MRAKGITYDTGFVRDGGISREHFDPDVVKRELGIIRDDLHCNAVQLTGGDPERLEVAASHAAGLGLEVWFSPYPLELTDRRDPRAVRRLRRPRRAAAAARSRGRVRHRRRADPDEPGIPAAATP